LVLADLAKCDGTRAITVGLLDAARSGSRLAGGVGGEMMARNLAAGGLVGGLLCSGHIYVLSLGLGIFYMSCILL